MFRSPVETKQRRELLFEVHEKVADIATQMANEPSVGLYYVQQHVQKAVPALVDAKKQVAHSRDITNFVREDVKAATTTIQGMKECGPATFERMRKSMEKAYQALPALKTMRGQAGSTLPTPLVTPRASPPSSPKKGTMSWKGFSAGRPPKATASSMATSPDLNRVAQSLAGIQTQRSSEPPSPLRDDTGA